MVIYYCQMFLLFHNPFVFLITFKMFLKAEYCWPPAWERKRQREWCSAVGTPCSLLLSVQMGPNPTSQTLLSTAGRKRGCEWERLHCRYEWQNTQKMNRHLFSLSPSEKGGGAVKEGSTGETRRYEAADTTSRWANVYLAHHTDTDASACCQPHYSTGTHTTHKKQYHVRCSRSPYRTPLKTMPCLCWTFKGLVHTKLKILALVTCFHVIPNPYVWLCICEQKKEWRPLLASSKITKTHHRSILKKVYIEILFRDIFGYCVGYAFPCSWAKQGHLKLVRVTPKAIL